MERETRTIELPSGIKAEILTRWTFDEYLKIEGASLRAAKNLRVVGKETMADIDSEAVMEGTKIALLQAIRKLTAKDGTEILVNIDNIGSLDMDDGIVLREEINKIQGSVKKK